MTHWLDLYDAAQPWVAKAVQHMQAPYAWVELFSMVCALLGSLVLALKGKHAGWGWVLFACSNAGWIVFAQGYGHWFFLMQQIGFSITSAIGIWTYLMKPACDTTCPHDDWAAYYTRDVQTHLICVKCSRMIPVILGRAGQ